MSNLASKRLFWGAFFPLDSLDNALLRNCVNVLLNGCWCCWPGAVCTFWACFCPVLDLHAMLHGIYMAQLALTNEAIFAHHVAGGHLCGAFRASGRTRCSLAKLYGPVLAWLTEIFEGNLYVSFLSARFWSVFDWAQDVFCREVPCRQISGSG